MGRVLNDSRDKFKLYMGHKRRCRVQHLSFVDAQIEVAEGDPETKGKVTMEYKMKFQPRMFREKPTDWYGQKYRAGMGVVLTYRTTAGVPKVHGTNRKLFLGNV